MGCTKSTSDCLSFRVSILPPSPQKKSRYGINLRFEFWWFQQQVEGRLAVLLLETDQVVTHTKVFTDLHILGHSSVGRKVAGHHLQDLIINLEEEFVLGINCKYFPVALTEGVTFTAPVMWQFHIVVYLGPLGVVNCTVCSPDRHLRLLSYCMFLLVTK